MSAAKVGSTAPASLLSAGCMKERIWRPEHKPVAALYDVSIIRTEKHTCAVMCRKEYAFEYFMQF